MRSRSGRRCGRDALGSGWCRRSRCRGVDLLEELGMRRVLRFVMEDF